MCAVSQRALYAVANRRSAETAVTGFGQVARYQRPDVIEFLLDVRLPLHVALPTLRPGHVPRPSRMLGPSQNLSKEMFAGPELSFEFSLR